MRGFCSHSSLDVHAKDLIKIPQKPPVLSTRRPPKKVPSWPFTSAAPMQYIQGIDERKQADKKKQDKYDIAKTEAMAKMKKEQQKFTEKVTRVVTRLYKLAPKAKSIKQVR